MSTFQTNPHTSRTPLVGAEDAHRFGGRWLRSLLFVGFICGCETAAPLVEPAAVDQPQQPANELPEDLPTPPADNERTTVVCTATELNSPSMFKHAPETSDALNGTGISNGSGMACPRPPCAIERGSDAKQTMVTVYFDLSSYTHAAVLDEPILTMTGTLKGSATAEISTRTIGPLAPIMLDVVGDIIKITVEASDFVDVTSASVSWMPRAKGSGNEASSTSRKPTPAGSPEEAVKTPQFLHGDCCEYCCDFLGCVCLEYAPYGTYCP